VFQLLVVKVSVVDTDILLLFSDTLTLTLAVGWLLSLTRSCPFPPSLMSREGGETTRPAVSSSLRGIDRLELSL